MTESTLTAGYSQIRQAIAEYLGFPRSSSDWDSDQENAINQAVIRGYAQFLTPPVVPAHEWSFVRPTTTLATVADTHVYDLPDNFGNIGNYLYYPAGEPYGPIEVTNIGRINEMRENYTSTTRPTHAATQPKSDSSAGQRWQIVLFPTPDAAYTLTYQYHAITNALSSSNPYPLGGALHSETVLQSCLAAAELRSGREETIQYQLFMQRLQASISLDKKSSPRYLGRMRTGERRIVNYRNNFSVTYSVDE